MNIPINEHEQKLTLSIDILDPNHGDRKEEGESDTYKRSRHLLVNVQKQGCFICGTHEQLETHHQYVEWYQANGTDFGPGSKLRNDHPNFPWETLRKPEDFVDSTYNLLVLCLTAETPVLMADGTEKPIAEVAVGDQVIGHDGLPHSVSDTMTRQYAGRLYEVDGVKASDNHPFLTPSGWVRADQLTVGQCIYDVGMLFPQMLRLRRIKNQILNAIIELIPVPVMHNFLARQHPSQMLLHNVPMLHEASLVPGRIAHGDAGIAPGGNGTVRHGLKGTGLAIESGQAAGVGTKPLATTTVFKGQHRNWLTACFTRFYDFCRTLTLLTNRRAFAGAGGVTKIDASGNQKRRATNRASFLHPRFHITRGWRPIKHIMSSLYEGTLYDITVEGSHSFIANGIVVHNCKKHHTGKNHGIHMLPHGIWLYQKYKLSSEVFSPDELQVAS